jgi:segregation and condensation protein A
MAVYMKEYQYKVSDFEGPLDLLLYLIEKNKVDIYNIPIVVITDQFNRYVAQVQEFDVNYASKFFVMAATLLQIKSRLLLPKPAVTTGEDAEEDPQEALVRQLVEYKQMKKVSHAMAALWEKRSRMLDRPRTPVPYMPQFSGHIEKDALYEAFRIVYQALDKEPELEIHIQRESYNLDTYMDTIYAYVKNQGHTIAVAAVFERCRSRGELIVTFMAVLELLKLGRLGTVSDGEDGNAIALRCCTGRRTRA